MKFRSVFFLAVCLFLLPASAARAQNKGQCRFHVALDYHYSLGFVENFYGEPIRRSDGYNMHGNSLHLTALYDITRRISAGAGIGADRYEEPGYNTFPVFGTFHYRPFRKFLDAYLYTNLGYGIFSGNGSDNYPGWVWDAGLGYTKMYWKHFGLNFQLGYNLKEFGGFSFFRMTTDGDYYIKKVSSVRHSLSLGIGLVF